MPELQSNPNLDSKSAYQIGSFYFRPALSHHERTELSTSSPQCPHPDDIMRHPWRVLIEKSEPNSITGNALLFSDFLESTSTWNQHHIIAFHMLDFNDLPIHCLYPQAFYPLIDDPVIIEVERLFTLSNDDIRQGKLDFVQTGPAFLFYRSLQDCLRTQQKTPSQHKSRPRSQQSPQPRVPFHQYTMSDNSGSSSLPVHKFHKCSHHRILQVKIKLKLSPTSFL